MYTWISPQRYGMRFKQKHSVLLCPSCEAPEITIARLDSDASHDHTHSVLTVLAKQDLRSMRSQSPTVVGRCWKFDQPGTLFECWRADCARIVQLPKILTYKRLTCCGWTSCIPVLLEGFQVPRLWHGCITGYRSGMIIVDHMYVEDCGEAQSPQDNRLWIFFRTFNAIYVAIRVVTWVSFMYLCIEI